MFGIKMLTLIITICLIWTGTALSQPDDSTFSGRNYQKADDRGEESKKRNHPPRLPDSSQIEHKIDEMSTALSLTDEQREKISKLHFDHVAEAKKLMDQPVENREKHRQQMENLRQEFEDEIKAVLTKEQSQKLEELLKSRGPHSGPPRQDGSEDIKPRKK